MNRSSVIATGMKTALTTTELKALLPNIQRVFDTGKPWEDRQLHYPVEAIVSAILLIKGVERHATEDSDKGFETNGWQFDWWQHFFYNGEEYVLSGSGYYGGHAFHIADK